MKVSKILASLLLGIGAVSFSSASFVSANPLTEIGNGQKCGKLNRILDDGVFSYQCVKKGRSKVWQNIGAAPTTTTTTTWVYIPPAVATTTTLALQTRIPPGGDWDGDYLYSEQILLYGRRYMHALCTSGNANWTLKLWANVNGSYVQKAESYPVVGDPWCVNPAYPVKHRFYWTVDWMGTQSAGNRYALTLKVTGMTSDALVIRTVYTSAGLEQDNYEADRKATRDANEIARRIACIFGKITGC